MTRERVLIARGFEWLPRDFDAVLDFAGVDRHACSRFAVVGGVEVYVKVSCIDGWKHRLRVSMRYALSGAPRLTEFRNLERLEHAGIPVASPVAAGEQRVLGLIARHFLIVRAVPGARDLETLVREGLAGQALTSVLERLAVATARMHAIGFLHRDLFMRNVLVTGEGDVAFIDCRKGEWHGLQLRGVAYDVACFDKWAATLLPHDARVAFLRTYVRHAGLADPAAFLERVESWRRWLVRRYLTKKRREHRRDTPLLDARRVAPDDVAPKTVANERSLIPRS